MNWENLTRTTKPSIPQLPSLAAAVNAQRDSDTTEEDRLDGAPMRPILRQQADLTHKYNLKTGRHGWLRLTPAYSVKIVEDLIGQSDLTLRIFDPFAGTATTALSAANHGHDAVTIDINPFLVWFGSVKTASYVRGTIESTRTRIAELR